MDVIERWTMFRRRDWEHDHGSLVPHNAPAPEPDEQLEVFDVVRADKVECGDGWTHAAKIGPLQAEITRLRDAVADAVRALEALPRRPSAAQLLDVRVELQAALRLRCEACGERHPYPDLAEGMGTEGKWSM